MTNLIGISRPRFWLYLFGPYLVGLAAATPSLSDLLRLDSVMFATYFLFPANLLVYGINDIFDFETDSVNPKKRGYESLVGPERRSGLLIAIAILNVPFWMAASLIAPAALPSLIAFAALSILYSAPPVRAKAIPILDSAFNLLYVCPGLFAYQMIAGHFPPAWVVVAAGLWTAAMHAYSAIPDIKADTTVGLSTIATLLGSKWTHVFCIACFSLAAMIAAANGSPVSFLGPLYVGLMLLSYRAGDDRVYGVYKIFPSINGISGFLIFLSVAWTKFL